ncbi:prion-like-(Q/N-rich) domain-bearing protein 25 [Hetaerina americana]|uniref:prion-like-(Q/N-rich) domain-bearing protein 25 n=1 Tax=Hetaerina americana TaxID=62018 RepID=UPI003A7F55D5
MSNLSLFKQSALDIEKESTYGGGCEEDWQCKNPLGDTVYCKDLICTCTPNALYINNKCWKQKLLSDSCSATEECIGGQNSVCQDSRCACKTGLVPKPSNDKCLPVAGKYQDPCEEDIQCTETFGSGSKCSNGKCVCQDGYHFKNHECMKNLLLGDRCGTGVDGDCFLVHSMGIEHVACTDGVCKCKGNLIATADNQKCLSEGQTDPGTGGGAESVQPLLITFVMALFARFFLS